MVPATIERIIQEVKARFQDPLREVQQPRRVVLRPRDSSGVVLQILQWKGGSDATVEDRIERIRNLQNQPEEK
jgi:hypothetical protein